MDIYFSARDLLQIPNFQHSKSLSTREPNQKLKDPTQPLRLLNKCHKVAPLQLELIQSKPFLFFVSCMAILAVQTPTKRIKDESRVGGGIRRENFAPQVGGSVHIYI
jgi:hypothetical protein